MAEQLITRSFVITEELRLCLEQWAADDDRSSSYILRDIIKQELARRQGAQPGQAISKPREAGKEL